MTRKFFISLLASYIISATIRAGVIKMYTSDRMSNNMVNCLAQDDNGYMWIATDYGLNRFDGYRFFIYTKKNGDTLSVNDNIVTRLYKSSDGTIWVGTINGLCLYDPENDNFRRILLTPEADIQPRISSICGDKAGNIYIGTSGYGLYVIDKGTKTARHSSRFSFRDKDDYYFIYIDARDRLWNCDNNNVIKCFPLNGKEGKPIMVYQSDLGEVKKFRDDGHGNVVAVCIFGLLRYTADGRMSKVNTDISHIAFTSSILLKDSTLLMGTQGNGLMTLSESGKLTPKKIGTLQNDFSSMNISALYEDYEGNLWVGCGAKGLAFVPKTQQLFFQLSPETHNMRMTGFVTSMCEDTDGSTLVTISGEGLFWRRRFSNTLNPIVTEDVPSLVYRDSHNRFWLAEGPKLYRLEHHAVGAFIKKFEGSDIHAIADDEKGNLYLSTFGEGLCVYNPATGQSKQFSMFMQDDKRRGFITNNWIFCIKRDSKGMIWFGTSSGLSCYDPARDTFKPYGWHDQLNGLSVYAIAEDHNGNIVIGTNDGLYLFDTKKNSTRLFPGSDKLKNIHVCYIAANGSDLWCSTTMGIWQYDAKQKKFNAFITGNGLTTHEYISCVGMTTYDGWLAFANPDGVTCFDPKLVNIGKETLAKPRLSAVVISGGTVNSAAMSGGKRIIDSPPCDADEIHLAYEDNSFSLEFSSFDYGTQDNTTLQYRIGDDKWQNAPNGGNAIAFYHLQPGTYFLSVRGNDHGHYSETSTLKLLIRPPWYLSIPAKTIYLLLLLGITAYLLWTYRKNKQHQLEEEKMQLLLGATHDIRSPLMLILNPLRQLMDQHKDDDDTQKLRIMDRNCSRILTLVNQILDLLKMDKTKTRLQCRETELNALIAKVCRTFDYDARVRHITFTFKYRQKVKAWVDQALFDKLIANLLSNAFKYTDDGGEITVTLKTDDMNAVIEVTDNGKGLKTGEEENIFKLFYQSKTKTATEGEGTGIGLNLCRKIVEMHHGIINAHNRYDGVSGSVFRILLPLGNSPLKPEEMVKEEETVTAEKSKTTAVMNTNGKNVLLVDDDNEITDYINQELCKYYRFTICRNGKEAINELLAKADKYDLVISDIMMPEMDGFSLLRLIKTNTAISQIPVILLTSEGNVGNRLKGLDKGADAFLAKPFLMEELHAIINNLITGRQRLRGKYSGAATQTDHVEQQQIEDSDQKLMSRIMTSINKHFSDSDYDVSTLCSEAGISRTQLHRKMKELTGLSTTEFLRNLRLEQAARLLREGHANVSQVGYSVGFSSGAHFSNVFKKHFGVTPTEYAKG